MIWRAMAGTPPNAVRPSSTASCNARSRSHLRMIRILDPPIGLPMIAAMPPMWNMGCAASVAGWRSGAGARPVMVASRRGAERHVPEVVQVTAVGAERTLRAARRARRVEDGDRVVGFEACDGVVGERRAVHQVVERGVGGAVGAHADEQRAAGPAVVDDPLEPFVVEERDRCARVLQRVA